MNIVAFVLIFTSQVLFILNWILDTDKNFFSYYISQYVHLKHGYLTYLGFLLTGLGSLLSTNLYYGLVTIIDIELFIYGLMLLLLGIFPVDKENKTTISGIIHSITAHLCFNSYIIVFTILVINGKYAQNFTYILISLTYIFGLLIILLPKKYKGILQKSAIFSQLILLEMLLITGHIP